MPYLPPFAGFTLPPATNYSSAVVGNNNNNSNATIMYLFTRLLYPASTPLQPPTGNKDGESSRGKTECVVSQNSCAISPLSSSERNLDVHTRRYFVCMQHFCITLCLLDGGKTCFPNGMLCLSLVVSCMYLDTVKIMWERWRKFRDRIRKWHSPDFYEGHHWKCKVPWWETVHVGLHQNVFYTASAPLVVPRRREISAKPFAQLWSLHLHCFLLRHHLLHITLASAVAWGGGASENRSVQRWLLYKSNTIQPVTSSFHSVTIEPYPVCFTHFFWGGTDGRRESARLSKLAR